MESSLLFSFVPHEALFASANKIKATIIQGRFYLRNENPVEGYCLNVEKPFEERLYFETYDNAKKYLSYMLEQ
jgi:hypothetical protein